MAEAVEEFLDIIDNRIEKHLNSNAYGYIRQRAAIVIEYNEDNGITYVVFPEDENQQIHTYYNKTPEVLEEGNQVRVFYTVNIDKGWIGAKCGETVFDVLEEKPMYISAKVANTQVINYDKTERTLLSVDFTVEGTDSDVVFSGNQLCDVHKVGNLNCIYKVDGAIQDFKPIENFDVGRRIFSHIYPMTLTKGKHNFSILMLSDEGNGTTGIGDVIGVLSGQISGLKNNAPPNENLVLYFAEVPENTEIILPTNMYRSGSGALKYVDWGDGSSVEESSAPDSVSHTYSTAGNYTVTIKSDEVNFGKPSYNPSFSDNFKNYITRIYFPDNTGEILWGSSTNNFPKLETLVIGMSATNLAWYFTASTKLSSLLLPETMTAISYSGFKNTSVSSLIIPKNVTSMPIESVRDCKSLTNLEVYSKVGINATDCVNLKRAVIDGNSVNTGKFTGCKSLEEITLGNKITTVVDLAFKDCSSLEEITLGNKITTVGSSAFYNCSSLKTITIPDMVTSIDTTTFYNCTNLKTAYLGTSVKSIGMRAFNGCISLTKVRLPKKLTTIGMYAFLGCSSLSDINFPEGLTTISEQAFKNTGSIIGDFPASLTRIDDSAFSNSGITSATLPKGTICRSYAFHKSGLEKLIIEDGFGTIPSYCFAETKELNIILMRLIDTLVPGIPGSVTIISTCAFYKSSISSVKFHLGISTIEKRAFEESGLIAVELPSSVTNVGYAAFRNCERLESVKLKSNIKLGNETFWSCGGLASVDMGSTNIIPDSCFAGCSKLNHITFASNTSIGAAAFKSCGFKELELLYCLQWQSEPTDHGGHYNIGPGAFANCVNLISVDGHKYRWNVGMICEHRRVDKDGNVHWDPEDLGLQEAGIYDTMGATEDNVFSGTGLKQINDFPKPADTSDKRYKLYHYTG